MMVIHEHEVLLFLAQGKNVTWIANAACWPNRRVRIFAGRHGYLITADGTPYRPPQELSRRASSRTRFKNRS